MAYTWPLPDGTPISQHFGDNPNNGYNPAGGHTGTDFAVPVGTPVRAIGDGVVKFADWASTLPADYRPDGSGPNPYWLAPNFGGIVVVIDHGPVVTVHAHLSDTKLSAGQSVKQGDVIALSGNTGGATSGPHLHFETLPDGWDFNNGTYGRVDPATFCTAYWSSIQAAGGGITPITPQEDDMPITQADADLIVDTLLKRDIPRQGPGAALGATTNFGAIGANFDSAFLNAVSAVNTHTDDAVKAIPAGQVNLTDAQVQALADKLNASLPAANLALLKSKL